MERTLSEVIAINKYLTVKELASATGKSEATVYRYLQQMISKGLLKRRGSRKKGFWELTAQSWDL